MIEILKKPFRYLIQWAMDVDDRAVKDRGLNIARGGRLSKAEPVPDLDSRNGLTVQVHYGRGGMILMARRWNAQKDEWDSVLYVISDGANVGEEVAKIVELESYRM